MCLVEHIKYLASLLQRNDVMLTNGNLIPLDLGHLLAVVRHEEGEALGDGERQLAVVVEAHHQDLVLLGPGHGVVAAGPHVSEGLDLGPEVDPDRFWRQQRHEAAAAAPVRPLLADAAQLPLLRVAHGPDPPVMAEHHEVVRPGGDLGDVEVGEDLHRELLNLHGLDKSYRPAAVPEGSPEVDLARVRQRGGVAVPGAQHHHPLPDVHLARHEALLLLGHGAAEAALVVAAEGPDPALPVQHRGVHPASHRVHGVRDLGDGGRPRLLHHVLAEPELARVALADSQHLAPASLVSEGQLGPLDLGLSGAGEPTWLPSSLDSRNNGFRGFANFIS